MGRHSQGSMRTGVDLVRKQDERRQDLFADELRGQVRESDEGGQPVIELKDVSVTMRENGGMFTIKCAGQNQFRQFRAWLRRENIDSRVNLAEATIEMQLRPTLKDSDG